MISLHSYLKKLYDDNCPSDYIDVIVKNSRPLISKNLPIILTLGQLSYVTGCSYSALHNIISRTIDPYRVFSIKKRNGGKRYICIPQDSLLGVQKWIHNNILVSPYALSLLSPRATAYKPSGGHILNASHHVLAPTIIKFDLTSFFESISERQIYYVFRSLEYKPLVAFCMARLCTRILPSDNDLRRQMHLHRWTNAKKYKVSQTVDENSCGKPLNNTLFYSQVLGHLPQGAPTSPMLSNLVAIPLDLELEAIAHKYNLVFTRYSDDIVFSTPPLDRVQISKIMSKICTTICHYGFRINSVKTKVAKAGARKIVTGLCVNDDVLRIPKKYKDDVRKELYYIGRFGLVDHCQRIGVKNQLNYLLRLLGRIRYILSVEPRLGEILMEKIKNVYPNIFSLETQFRNECTV